MQRIGVAVALARWHARKCVSVARDQDVAVELPLHGAERLGVTPRNELVAMAQSELKRADFDHLALRQAVVNGVPKEVLEEIEEDEVQVVDTTTRAAKR